MFFNKVVNCFKRVVVLIKEKKKQLIESKFITDCKNRLSSSHTLKTIKYFFCDHFTMEKRKIYAMLFIFAIIMAIAIGANSIPKVAIYVKGERVGYAADPQEAIALIEEYNDFAEKNHGKTDILLQNEVSVSPNLLSGEALQDVIDESKNEEFTNAYMLYIDDALVAVVEDPSVLRNAISQLESDVTTLLGYNASIYNTIKMENTFYPVEKLTDPASIYHAICGYDTIAKENITPSVLLAEDKTPIKLYSINGILFETFEYYKEERFLESITVHRPDDTMYEGSQKLVNAGNDGAAIDMYKRTIFEGEVQSTELIDTTIIDEKADTVILTGTKPIVWEEEPKVLLFPLTTSNFRYSSEFGMRNHPVYEEWRMHSGIDLGCAQGSSIIAADSGVVTISSDHGGSAGIYIEIQHDNGLKTRYLHLSKRLVKVGDRVYRGQQIALSGNTGTSTGPHLHFTVIDEKGKFVNPRLYTQMP